MDHNSDRDATSVCGAEGPEPPSSPIEEGAVGGLPDPDSPGSVFVSDEEDADIAPPIQPQDHTSRVEVHHFHHSHCDNQECSQENRGRQSERHSTRHLESTLNRVVLNQVQLHQSILRLTDFVADTNRNQLRTTHCTGCPRQHPRSHSAHRRRSPARQPAERSRSRWEPIQVLSPVRRHRGSPERRGQGPSERRGQSSPVRHRRQSPVQFLRLPQGLSVSPAQPSSPPIGQPLPPRRADSPPPRSFHLSPSTSPSALGATVRGAFPHFTEEQKRNTRKLLLRKLISLRLTNLNLSSVGGWRRFVQAIRFSGEYSNDADISLAWNIAFEQQTQAHFTSLWNRDPEILRRYLPRQERFEREDLIHF